MAVCLTGTARTLTRPHVHESIAEKLVGGLQANHTAVDVFAVIRLEEHLSKRRPDSYTVRQLCRAAGYVPAPLRRRVWEVLLNVPRAEASSAMFSRFFEVPFFFDFRRADVDFSSVLQRPTAS